MIFVDQELPPRIAFGMQRRQTWRTVISQSQDGREVTDQKRSKMLMKFDLSFAVRVSSDYEDVDEHFAMMRGRAKKFPATDPLDHSVTAARGELIAVTSYTSFQLAKAYGSGAAKYLRTITRPKAGARVFRLRSSVTTDITSSCTISLTAGSVAITGGVVLLGDVLSWSGEFFTPCRYDVDELPGLIVNKQPGDDGELFVQCESIPVVEVLE
jgi:uncharacterized protein (TIGR02217 family)